MEKRPIVTLLTDFGEGSYVPSVKGVLLGLAPEARLVDISHDIEPGAAGCAGFLLSRTAPWFPPGTIHFVVVDPGVGTDRLGLIVEADGSVYVGPDNGVLGLVIERAERVRAFRIEEGEWTPDRVCPTFHGRDIFAPVAGRIARGEPIGQFGPPIDSSRLTPFPIRPPRREENRFLGEVVWVDRFGNLITNLERCAVEEWAGDGPFRAVVGGTSIDTRVHTFMEADAGDLIVLHGSWETVEIAVVTGNAAKRLGVASGEPVRLEKIHGR
ncbi:MAG: SAM-dependent chlorinase/fluorinase [Candidatus Eisenbacteria bacterium]|nr:SAM-dependent chlorinase/fluorinase [Candidatus Eisenbacteria bacterium]